MKKNTKTKAKSDTPARDRIYRVVTDCIIEALQKARDEAGIVPWHRASYGTQGGPVNHVTGKPYHGINLILLEPGEWLTWNQIKACGGNLKKGSRGRPVLYFNKITKKETDPQTGEETEKSYWMERYYTVFRLSDTEGIEPRSGAFVPPADPLAESASYLKEYAEREAIDGLEVVTGIGPGPQYSVSEDTIYLPAISAKEKDALYWAGVFRAMVRSTGGGTRLGRKDFYRQDKITSSHLREELLDEMGSAMLVNCAGFNSEKLFKDSMDYINKWIDALNADCRLVVDAATRAEKAVRFILDDRFQDVTTSDDEALSA